ncbi:MAG: ABC transporter permease [Ruminococcaceae bacterium]|nr:ABC transporter permease [Oscillospiraceae bacterium]
MKQKRSLLERAAAVPHMLWAVLFIIGPLLFVLYFAFTDTKGEFSFSNIELLSSYSHIFFLSICFSLVATAFCLLIGYPLAFVMSRAKPSTQKLLTVLLMLPMWISLLIRTYSLMTLLDNGGLVNSLLTSMGLAPVTIVGTGGAVILGMIYDFLPYMVLPIYTSMSKLDGRYLEAAADLGCNGFQTLFRVILPLTVPGIVSGVTMVFVPSISTFYISQKLGGGNFDLIGDTIERQFKFTSTYHVGAALSLVMMILILISIAVMNRFSDSDGEDMPI